ncbi:MAG TPA: UDP-N-acetylmuramate dehydrogenase [Candidatus Methylomirabilis sp.]|nr:UDP-N-acetylmuramate dehydrogenase [Candidatus Methylomirabilis sp.]
MLARISGAVRFKEPLCFHTSLRMGGPADFFIVARDVDDVRYALTFAEHEDLPVSVIGGGNNLLVSDRGISGVVLKLDGVLARAAFHGDEVVVGAGVSLSALGREAAARDLGGLECMTGIPGTVGGALATRAGTRDGGIMDLCSAVQFLYPDGTLGELRPQVHVTGGQTLDIPRGAIVVSCRLQLVRRSGTLVWKEIRQRLKARKASEPIALASAGFVWKNPRASIAQRLIDAAGLRGKRRNGAEISAKSSNFIINRGGATSSDVLGLMEMTRERVEARFGITLESEIRMLGFSAAPAMATEPLELATAR